MHKIFKALLFFSFISTIWACKSDYEHSLEQTKDCIEDKADDLENKSIDQALANYAFDEARAYLSCYEDACFYDFEKRVDCSGTASVYSRSEKLDTNPHYKQQRKIVSAEMAYYIVNNEFNRALNVASEAEMISIYKDKISGTVTKLASSGKNNEVIDLLINWPFEGISYNLDESYQLHSTYNSQREQYNTILNSIVKISIVNKNYELAKKILTFYEPIITKGEEEGYSNNKSKLSEEPRKSAEKKLRDAGLI